MDKNKEKKILIILIGILILLDQIIKIIMLLLGKNVIQNIELKENIKYIIINLIIIGIIIRYINSNNSFIKKDSKIVLSFAIAGAISNVIDRIIRGYVINYINISGFFSINLSYIYIILSWLGLAIILTKNTRAMIKENKKHNEKNKSGKWWK